MTDKEKVDALLRFIETASNGSVKPYNHEHFLSRLERISVDTKQLLGCCPPQAEIRDSKDFKPYITAACEKLADLLELNVKIDEGRFY